MGETAKQVSNVHIGWGFRSQATIRVLLLLFGTLQKDVRSVQTS